MNARSILMAIVSLAIGVALLMLLVAMSGVHLQALLSRLAEMNKTAFVELAALMAVNAYLSSQKWRLTDRVMRGKSGAALPKFEYFALTSMGTALGQFLPVQLSMPIVRTMGTWVHGRAIRRGALGTYFEQGFEMLFAVFIMAGSLVTYLLHGGFILWLILAGASALLAFLSVEIIMIVARRLAARVCADTESVRWRRSVAELSKSGLLEPALGRKLMCLSGLRFIVFVLMADRTTTAIYADIPLWHFAMAMPFAMLATALGITPGGLGVTDLTYAGLLHAMGTPLAVTTQWALANRVLIFAAAMVMAVPILPLFFALRARKAASESSPQAQPADSTLERSE